VSSVPRHRRKRKIRRTGQHTAPSQVEKVAQTAGKAAPAVVAVGALAAAVPQIEGSAAAASVASAQHVEHARLDAAMLPAHGAARSATTEHSATARTASAARTYTVHSGDTLSAIAQRFYGVADDWRGLYTANHAEIGNPQLIYPGQQLKLPQHLPTATLSAQTSYQPRHAAAGSDEAEGAGGSAGSAGQASGPSQPATTQVASTHSTGLAGTLSCSGLEQLWQSAGGSAGAAVMAASIAMAESGGNQYATGTVGERGYWQINPVNGALSTYDPHGNARAAVIMSANGTNWSPWTTYTSGAYAGRC
jgi:LysM repeat protein